MHRVRAALDQLKNKPDSGVKKLEQRHYWLLGSQAFATETTDEVFTEGKEVLALHRRKERNRKAVQRKKQRTLEATGSLRCEACDFDFQLVYGDLGYGFAECHHRIPLANLKEEYRIKLSELAIVCANCHRMLHKRQNLTVEDLRSIIQTHTCVHPKQS